MRITVSAHLHYHFARSTDVLLQVEAAGIPEQTIEHAHISVPQSSHFVRVPAHDGIGDRIWLCADGSLTVDYEATIAIQRIVADCAALPSLPPRDLPGETVEYLMPSRYCPADQFAAIVEAEFGGLHGGAKIVAMRDWINASFSYVPGSSNSETTALDTFVKRQGVCRDYAHVLIAMARAAGVPARIASVYAIGVEPQDFHAVAEVFLAGEWHLLDATGMAEEGAMAKIGVGRDAADVSFLTAFGAAEFVNQRVRVSRA